MTLLSPKPCLKCLEGRRRLLSLLKEMVGRHSGVVQAMLLHQISQVEMQIIELETQLQSPK
jgi:hypothetical protein